MGKVLVHLYWYPCASIACIVTTMPCLHLFTFAGLSRNRVNVEKIQICDFQCMLFLITLPTSFRPEKSPEDARFCKFFLVNYPSFAQFLSLGTQSSLRFTSGPVLSSSASLTKHGGGGQWTEEGSPCSQLHSGNRLPQLYSPEWNHHHPELENPH